MSEDFDLGIQIAPVPTFRDDDGLATSSRNRYLTAAERQVALALPAALAAGRAEAAAGPQAVAEAARRSLDEAAGALPDGGAAALGAAAPHLPLTVDYLALVDPRTFQPVPPGFTGTAILAVAARVGGTRLIDNVQVEFG